MGAEFLFEPIKSFSDGYTTLLIPLNGFKKTIEHTLLYNYNSVASRKC